MKKIELLMETYTKPALTYDKQIELLESRGLQITDKARAKRHLSNVSYYRLSAYMLPFKEMDENGVVKDKFLPNTTWDNVYDLYKFDRKLRLLVFDAIERIEIALRTQIIYQLSHKYGPHWQDNASVFNATPNPITGRTVYDDIQKHINEQLTANKKVQFIEHYVNTYDTPPNPPSWMSVELLYLSELSKICRGLNDKQDAKDIAAYFGIHNEDIFCSWIHSMNYIRNICAHHGRLWNITLAVRPTRYRRPKSGLVWLTPDEADKANNSRLYYFLCTILYLLQTVNPKTKFRERFKNLLKEYPVVNPHFMGFPKDWEQHPLCNGSLIF